MKSLKDIKKIVAKFNVKPRPEMRSKVINEALEIQRNQKQQSTSGTYTWRLIMTSKITRLVAAAVIIVTVVFGITLLNKSATPAYGISEAFGLIRQAKTLHVKGWDFDTYYSDTFDTEISVKKPFEFWYDFENGQYRLDTTDFDGSGKYGWPENLNHDSTICDGEYEMSGGWSWRTTGESWKNIRFRKVDKPISASAWMKNYQLDNIEGAHKIDEETIDGVQFDVWEVEVTVQTRENGDIDQHRLQAWISPTTGEMGRFKEWRKVNDGPWIQTKEYSMLERNVSMSLDLFVTEPPEGDEYRLENTKETATESTGTTAQFDIYDETRSWATLMYYVDPIFRLNDGSFLACWQSVDASESHDQTNYFQNLEIGGNLPKLPSEVYALSPSPNPRNVQFMGYHLAYTQKETEKGPRWYEWSLYVPDKEPPSPDMVLSYLIHYRYNTNGNKHMRSTQVRFFEWQEIKTKHDLETLVLGAIAERSDGGFIPEHVTYEKVLRLSEELRDSLTQ